MNKIEIDKLNTFSYEHFYQSIEEKVLNPEKHKDDQYYDYTVLNFQRIKRITKTVSVISSLKEAMNKIKQATTWLVLVEDWCGDVAQNLPVINKIAEISSLVNLQLIYRDKNLEIMDKFLTNGGRSIPKLIALNEGGEVMYHWGPRPKEAQKMVLNYKRDSQGKTYQQFAESLHKWYAKDKYLGVQKEIEDLIC